MIYRLLAMGMLILNQGMPVPVVAPPPPDPGGALVNGQPFVVTGSFITNSGADLLADDCSSGSVPTDNGKWSGYWPTAAPSNSSNMAYSSGMLGVPMPHANTTRYMTGAHESSGNSTTGQNVAAWKNFTKANNDWLYLSFYAYVYQGWVFTGGMSPEDGNFKTFGYSVQGSLYEGNNWYEALWDPLGRGLWSTTFNAYETVLIDDGFIAGGGYSLDQSQVFWNRMLNPIGVWVKREILMKISNVDGGGKLVMREDNTNSPGVNYTGSTDKYPGTTRSSGMGGFARSCNSINNRRYFTDMRMDVGASPCRVVLANNITYTSATIVETQPRTSGSGSAINCTCWKGKLSSGTVHVHIRDELNGHQYLGTRVMT